MPSLFPGLIQGQGVKRVLREQGTVYGEIGGFPGVREMQSSVRDMRLREEANNSSELWSVKDNKSGASHSRRSAPDSRDNGTGKVAGVGTGTETRTGTGLGIMKTGGQDTHTGSADVDDVLIDADDLCVEYTSGSARKMALNGLTFQMKKGERVALLGESLPNTAYCKGV